jgi:excisionase family DNA binding protein
VTDRYLTARQVAELLAVSPETILRRHRSGELVGYRIATNALRFRERDVLDWLEGRRVVERENVA